MTNTATIPSRGQRLLSIDILRALTMFFMIFVNDFWYLGYPLAAILGISLPASLPGNLLGLGKSLLFSFAIILLVGQMERRKVRLKI